MIYKRSLFLCGTTGNRTRDTRIFSPLLYQLSYGTIRNPKIALLYAENFRSWCKGNQNFRKSKFLARFFLTDFRRDATKKSRPCEGSSWKIDYPKTYMGFWS